MICFSLLSDIDGFRSANRTLIPIHCKVVKDLDEFDGAWTVSRVSLSLLSTLAKTDDDDRCLS